MTEPMDEPMNEPMNEPISAEYVPLADPEQPHLCLICEQVIATHICENCLKFAGPQSILHQRDWESWEPADGVMKPRPALADVESQFQVPAITPSPVKRPPSEALKRRLQSLKPEGDQGESDTTSLPLIALKVALVVCILFYIMSMILGIDPLYLIMRLINEFTS